MKSGRDLGMSRRQQLEPERRKGKSTFPASGVSTSVVSPKSRESQTEDITLETSYTFSHQSPRGRIQDNHACRQDRNQRLWSHRKAGAEGRSGEGSHGTNLKYIIARMHKI